MADKISKASLRGGNKYLHWSFPNRSPTEERQRARYLSTVLTAAIFSPANMDLAGTQSPCYVDRMT